MVKFICCLLSINFLMQGYLPGLSLEDYREKYGETLDSRFVRQSDPKVDSLANIPLRNTWWSRPHEYAWASQFADENAVVLDAACGISHPFKWHLGGTCKSTWACDTDLRIGKLSDIFWETFEDLGPLAHAVLKSNPELYYRVKLVKASICNLPSNMPQFDRIFCISTLEHMSDRDRRTALKQFATFLAPDGLLVLTVDYPEVSPYKLIKLAQGAGLVPVGNVCYDQPVEDLLTDGYLSIYRCVLVHQKFVE